MDNVQISQLGFKELFALSRENSDHDNEIADRIISLLKSEEISRNQAIEFSNQAILDSVTRTRLSEAIGLK